LSFSRKLKLGDTFYAHLYGRHKAFFFKNMGFSSESWEIMVFALRDHAQQSDVVRVDDTEFGTRYIVEGQLRTPNGRNPIVRVVWLLPIRWEEVFMIKELETVVLTVDLPEHRLKKGDVGTVVMVHSIPGYEVEFMTLGGETLVVVSLSKDQVRPVGSREVAQARPF
jgi:hypothetical protein